VIDSPDLFLRIDFDKERRDQRASMRAQLVKNLPAMQETQEAWVKDVRNTFPFSEFWNAMVIHLISVSVLLTHNYVKIQLYDFQNKQIF